MSKLISIVVPCYNEMIGLKSFCDELMSCLDTLNHYDREVILVNDGSKDATRQVIYDLSQQYDIVKGINFSRNFGKEIALSAGIEYAKGDAVITIDSDGQHPISKISDFVYEREQGYDIVYNRRPNNLGANWIKRHSSKLFYKFFNAISEFELESQTTDYRLLDRTVIDIFLTFTEKNRIYRGLIDWIGFNKKALVFDALPNPDGRKPSYNYLKLTQLAVNSVTSFSVWPLKVVANIGGLIVLMSGFVLIVMLTDLATGNSMGRTNLGLVVMVNTFLVGVMMIAMGFIAIYIAQIHEEVKGRPLFIVKQKIGF